VCALLMQLTENQSVSANCLKLLMMMALKHRRHPSNDERHKKLANADQASFGGAWRHPH
jgi:hypothetical protein